MDAETPLKIFDYRTVDKADEFEDIPILDVGPYLAGEPGARKALADNIRFIQETIGFYVIVNHGVSRELLDNAYGALERFFALPTEEKLKLKFGEASVGYIAPKSTVYVTSKINENTKQDLNETLVTALERPADHPYLKQGLRFVGPNKWPENLPGFREAIVAFQHAIDDRLPLTLGQSAGLDHELDRRSDDLVHIVRLEIQQTAPFGDGLKQKLHGATPERSEIGSIKERDGYTETRDSFTLSI